LSLAPVPARPQLLDATWHDGDQAPPVPSPGSLVFVAHGAPGWVRFAAAAGPAPSEDSSTVRYALRQADGPGGSFLGSTPAILSVRVYPPVDLRDDMIRWIEEEHSDRMRRIGGAAWYLGYLSTTGRYCQLNVWGLSSPAQIDTPEWAEGNATEWSKRQQPALAGRDRLVYRVMRNRE
jgi:hypothetical protein